MNAHKQQSRCGCGDGRLGRSGGLATGASEDRLGWPEAPQISGRVDDINKLRIPYPEFSAVDRCGQQHGLCGQPLRAKERPSSTRNARLCGGRLGCPRDGRELGGARVGAPGGRRKAETGMRRRFGDPAEARVARSGELRRPYPEFSALDRCGQQHGPCGGPLACMQKPVRSTCARDRSGTGARPR